MKAYPWLDFGRKYGSGSYGEPIKLEKDRNLMKLTKKKIINKLISAKSCLFRQQSIIVNERVENAYLKRRIDQLNKRIEIYELKFKKHKVTSSK